MNKKGQFFFGFVNILLVMTTVFCFTVIYQIHEQGYVSIFNMSLFRVVTGSMEPTIPVDAMLICKEIDIDDVEVLDIVCFESQDTQLNGIIITHRVVDILEDENNQVVLRTKGDANSIEDTRLVSEENLIGKIVWHSSDESIATNLVSVLKSGIGFASFIILPCMFISTMIMRDSIKSIRKELKNLNEIDEIEELPSESFLSDTEYVEMKNRIMSELEEELKNSAAKEKIKRDS